MLKCKNLTYNYDDGSRGIHEVDFDLNKGKIIGLIGANGSGKSTFFKCLLGLLKPQSGLLFFNGSPLEYSKGSLKQLRKSVNLVFQDPERQLFYSDVKQDVAMGPKNLGYSEAEIAKAVDSALKAVNGENLTHKPIQYLSFGQKKRVAIAGILALSCEVLLMDEPETGLDPQMKRDMIQLLKKLSHEGKKIVLSSHNMDLIYDLCDYIYVIKDGAIIDQGEKETIMCNQKLLEESGLERPLQVVYRETKKVSLK